MTSTIYMVLRGMYCFLPRGWGCQDCFNTVHACTTNIYKISMHAFHFPLLTILWKVGNPMECLDQCKASMQCNVNITETYQCHIMTLPAYLEHFSFYGTSLSVCDSGLKFLGNIPCFDKIGILKNVSHLCHRANFGVISITP